jgi:hypothetical protein
MASACWQRIENTLAFSVSQKVQIHGRIPMLANLFIYAGLVLYIGVYVLYINHGFLAHEAVVGTVSIDGQVPPTTAGRSCADLTYCQQYYDEGRHAPLQPGDPGYISDPLPCEYRDQLQTIVPAVVNGALVSTRTKTSIEVLRCTNTTAPCDGGIWADDDAYKPNETYSAFIDDITFRFQHYIMSSYLSTGISPDQMSGKMVSQSGQVLQRFGFGHPILTLRQLLQAAGVDLNDQTTSQDFNPFESIRHSGTGLVVTIGYSNAPNYGSDVTFEMRVSHEVSSSVKWKTVIDSRATHRKVLDHHGVRIVVFQNGTISQFSWQTLVLSVISSLGIAAFAHVIVESALVRWSPNSSIVSQACTDHVSFKGDSNHDPRTSFEMMYGDSTLADGSTPALGNPDSHVPYVAFIQ